MKCWNCGQDCHYHTCDYCKAPQYPSYYPCPRCGREMEYGGECYGCHYGYQPISDRDAHQMFLESMS